MVIKHKEKSPSAYRTIGEAAATLSLAPHVLRFWESRFSQIRPMKRTGGRRYYSPRDLKLLLGIKILLHDEDYSIKQAQKLLSERGFEGMLAWVDKKTAEKEKHDSMAASSSPDSPGKERQTAQASTPLSSSPKEYGKAGQIHLQNALAHLEQAYDRLHELRNRLNGKM